MADTAPTPKEKKALAKRNAQYRSNALLGGVAIVAIIAIILAAIALSESDHMRHLFGGSGGSGGGGSTTHKPCLAAACVEQQCPGIACPANTKLVFTINRQCVCAVPAASNGPFVCLGPFVVASCTASYVSQMGLLPTYDRICSRCVAQTTNVSDTCAFCPSGSTAQVLPEETTGPLFLRSCVANTSITSLVCPDPLCDSVCVAISGLPTLCSPCVHYQPNSADTLAVACTVGNCPNCSDGRHNGDETGVDCGGSCAKVCCAGTLPASTQLTNSNTLNDVYASCPATCATVATGAWYGGVTMSIAPPSTNCTCIPTNCVAACAGMTASPGTGCTVGNPVKAVSTYIPSTNCPGLTGPQQEGNCSTTCTAFDHGCIVSVGAFCAANFGCLVCVCE